ncbi:MAG: translation elongation factor 4 [candidate division WOR-3 bacterium]
MLSKIRNFCIIAHIDHGKSTLADRFLEITKTLRDEEIKEQILDSMDLEREKGITIKMHPVRMEYKGYILNLIDTPGHVDFTYEVSRSLKAVEGAILLVDASQGIEAQTISNLYLALEQNLVIIPAINKIDLPNAEVERVENQIKELIGNVKISKISAKYGWNVEELLNRVIEEIPHPKTSDNKLRALIFDAIFDEYLGVIPYVRVFDGEIKPKMKILFKATNREYEVLEVGYFHPKGRIKSDKLSAGEIGYIVANIREIREAKVGDTIIDSNYPQTVAIEGFREIKPMIYAGIYPINPSEFENLRKAIEKLSLNDAALKYIPENSPALGPGFRIGFLGLLHLEIFKERIKREHNLDIVITMPNVEYKVILTDKREVLIDNPKDFPDYYEKAFEPYVLLKIITPSEYLGNLITLLQSRRGIQKNIFYLDSKTVELEYEIPLYEIIFDLFDKVKSLSRGYASMDYEFIGFRESDLVRVDIYVANEKVDALSFVVPREKAYETSRKIVEKLRNLIPRQLFEVKIQASIGKRVIASERIPPIRKDVTAKCYGGDITRKRKLLERQKEGKKRMKMIGRVEVPSEIFLQVMKIED